MGLLRFPKTIVAASLSYASTVLKAQTGRLHRLSLDEGLLSEADDKAGESSQLSEQTAEVEAIDAIEGSEKLEQEAEPGLYPDSGSEIYEAQKQSNTTSEILSAKDDQLAEAKGQIADLERLNDGLATIMARDREASAYYVNRALGLAGLLEGRPMSWEDKKLIEEKEAEIRYLEGHLDNMTNRAQELEGKLDRQQAQLDTEIPALTAQLEEREKERVDEIGRAEAFKNLNALKVEVLKGAVPEEVFDALRQEHELLRRDNKHAVTKAQKLARANKALEVAGKTNETKIDAMSVELSELRKQVQSLEYDNRVLEVEVSRVTWQLELKSEALAQAENDSHAAIEVLEETVASLNHEVQVANNEIEEIVQEATRFSHLPAVTQDQVRLDMIDEQLRKAKEELGALMQKMNEDQASLAELREKKENLEYEVQCFKKKEKEAILREPYEEWVREDRRKRAEDAEAKVADLQEKLRARDEKIQEMHSRLDHVINPINSPPKRPYPE